MTTTTNLKEKEQFLQVNHLQNKLTSVYFLVFLMPLRRWRRLPKVSMSKPDLLCRFLVFFFFLMLVKLNYLDISSHESFRYMVRVYFKVQVRWV